MNIISPQAYADYRSVTGLTPKILHGAYLDAFSELKMNSATNYSCINEIQWYTLKDMSKIDKLIAKLKSKPRDFTWDSLVVILSSLGYKDVKKGKTAGSRRKFVHTNGHTILLHKPHPGNTLKSYQVNQVLSVLYQEGLL